jgi:MFS family permease
MLSPKGLLREGNALLNISFTAGAAIGPAIAGLVVAGAGVRTGLLVDAVSFAAVAALLATAPGLPAGIPSERSWAERLRVGLQYVRERVQLRRLLAAQAAAFVFFATVIPIEVVFAKETLGSGDVGYGVLLASWGGGMLAGSIAFAALNRLSLRMLLPISTLAVGLAYIGTAASPNLLVACIASAIGGVGNGIQWVGLMTAVQQLTQSAFQARVISLLEALAKAMPGVGFLVGGALAAAFNPRVSYAVAGTGVIVVLIAASVALLRAGWRGTEGPELEPTTPRVGGASDAPPPQTPP